MEFRKFSKPRTWSIIDLSLIYYNNEDLELTLRHRLLHLHTSLLLEKRDSLMTSGAIQA